VASPVDPDGPFLEARTPAGRVAIAFGKEPLSIGRHSSNKVIIADDMASRQHAVVERVTEGFRLRDLDSRNGVKVNGQLVKSALILPGDVITIGKTIMRIVIPGMDPAQLQKRSNQRRESDDAPIQIAGRGRGGDDDEVALKPQKDDSDPISRLMELAESLPDRSVNPYDISLYNARGVQAHGSKEDDEKTRSKKSSEEADSVTLWRLILTVCFRTKASDIHVEPKNENYTVRVRVDGNMVDVCRMVKELGVKVSAVIKILCDIDIAARNIVQEGNFSARLLGRRVDFRVSFAPALYGQKLVIRILDAANAPAHIKDLNLPKNMTSELRGAIEQEAGMILVCGPTGSGKTTTLYSLIRDIDTDQRNVVTIEDPVEIQLEGVTQLPVKDDQGNTFSALLRSVLRQDPDVILVGEIRDAETARIAMQAAITGHLVFSTVHSRDTVGTVFRLLDLGIEPYMIAQGLHVVLSQRLVRRLCPTCRKPVKPTPEQLEKMGPKHANLKTIFEPRGCAKCLGTGFWGRQCIFELLSNNAKLKDVILKNPTMGDIVTAMGESFQRLDDVGYQMVADGVAPFDEVDRAVS